MLNFDIIYLTLNQGLIMSTFLTPALSFGSFATGVLLAYKGLKNEESLPIRPSEPKAKIEKIPQDKMQDLDNQLGNIELLLLGVKKILKWSKKGLKQVRYIIASGILNMNLRSWIASPKAAETVTLLVGAVTMAILNKKPSKGFGQDVKTITISAFGESKKIIEAHALMISLANLAKSPKKQLLPVAFATLMIACSHLLSRLKKA